MSLSLSSDELLRKFWEVEEQMVVTDMIEEYFKMQHAELVSPTDLQKPTDQVFYLPMCVVRKEHSTTTKIRAVFDASAKSSSGVSLNDTLFVGPIVHSPLIDVFSFPSHCPFC